MPAKDIKAVRGGGRGGEETFNGKYDGKNRIGHTQRERKSKD